MENTAPAILQRLKYQLQALALPYDIQSTLLPNFVCTSDELALDFDYWYGLVVSSVIPALTDIETKLLDDLNKRLDEMSQNQELWTDKALGESKEWENVRLKARQILSAFRWPLERPLDAI